MEPRWEGQWPDPGGPPRSGVSAVGAATAAAAAAVHHEHGFGRVDAAGAVAAAASWSPLEPERSASGRATPNVPIPDDDERGVSSTITLTEDISIQHVEAIFSADDHTYWGDLEIVLTSPSGTESVLAEPHYIVFPAHRYDAWQFGVTRLLEEGSAGRWTLTIRDLFAQDSEATKGFETAEALRGIACCRACPAQDH